jgi:predicted transcriptional regulator of viral defense system
MEFENLLKIVENQPVFETGLLLSGDVDPFNVRKQLSRWTASGKIYQLRRGLYSLAQPYQKSVPHPFLIANRLVAGSYVSLQSALAYYGMIPELVPTTTSVTTAHPTTYNTPFGQYHFRHIQVSWFRAYRRVELGNDQSAFIATPEKALLDLVYLQPGGDKDNYLRSLRLQVLDRLNMELLQRLASTANKPKLNRVVKTIQHLVEEEKSEYELL